MTQKVFDMTFKSVYQALIAKVDRKGGQEADVDQLTSWLTGLFLRENCRAQKVRIKLWRFYQSSTSLYALSGKHHGENLWRSNRILGGPDHARNPSFG